MAQRRYHPVALAECVADIMIKTPQGSSSASGHCSVSLCLKLPFWFKILHPAHKRVFRWLGWIDSVFPVLISRTVDHSVILSSFPLLSSRTVDHSGPLFLILSPFLLLVSFTVDHSGPLFLLLPFLLESQNSRSFRSTLLDSLSLSLSLSFLTNFFTTQLSNHSFSSRKITASHQPFSVPFSSYSFFASLVSSHFYRFTPSLYFTDLHRYPRFTDLSQIFTDLHCFYSRHPASTLSISHSVPYLQDLHRSLSIFH